ncbi:MAG: 4-hydroxythreonine-4-phosphate dehydrogenase PdxA, partial [Heliobacteriaceae bacterium]|nr:4-hydroxythreonine-4-phosphate dehydrogenase PdxA [Heliobacteriaceae bacterium]
HEAGYKFNGQTEILEHFLAHDGQKAEMLFVAGDFRVLLLTRHVPLKEVRLTREMVEKKVILLHNFLPPLQGGWRNGGCAGGIKLALCGLNPHAGEGGILGREEIEILIPAAQALRAKGINITDPLPADTLFSQREKYDCIIACYHDQGLIPIKTVAGMKVVNMTIGLDVIRTSPPHGTAFDIAGKGIADPTGMIEAIKAAICI